MYNIQSILQILACLSLLITRAVCFDFATTNTPATLAKFLVETDDTEPRAFFPVTGISS